MFEKVKSVAADAKENDQHYFIYGTVGEVKVSSEQRGECTFELIPDDEMKVVRNELDEHIWLSDTASFEGKIEAVICKDKTALIDFSGRLELLPLLIAAKINGLRVRVYAAVVSREGTVRLSALAIV